MKKINYLLYIIIITFLSCEKNKYDEKVSFLTFKEFDLKDASCSSDFLSFKKIDTKNIETIQIEGFSIIKEDSLSLGYKSKEQEKIVFTVGSNEKELKKVMEIVGYKNENLFDLFKLIYKTTPNSNEEYKDVILSIKDLITPSFAEKGSLYFYENFDLKFIQYGSYSNKNFIIQLFTKTKPITIFFSNCSKKTYCSFLNALGVMGNEVVGQKSTYAE